jgi:hypothetical protein
VNKVAVFLPCCNRKSADGSIFADGLGFSLNELPNTLPALQNGRMMMQNCIKTDSTLTSSIVIYDGFLYRPLKQHYSDIEKKVVSCQLHIFIISAGYGLVKAPEKIHNYDAEMKSKVAFHWREAGLINVIGDSLCTLNPSHVFGYFAGNPVWNPSGAQYRYFFTEGLKDALNHGLKVSLGGCFYRRDGRGVGPILSALGGIFIEHMQQDFSEDFALDVMHNCRRDGNITIGFQKIQ